MASAPPQACPFMLTELQQRIAVIVLRASPDPELALAGGAALISGGLVHRRTVDLDFFTTAGDVEDSVSSIEEALRRDGLTVERRQTTPTFVRLVVAGGDDQCQVDVAQDARMMPPGEGPLGQTIATEELAADKVLALFSRAAGRDFIDVYFLTRLFDKTRLLELAKEKDPGFDAGVFADMLGAINRLDRQEFDVDDETHERLREFFAEWLTEFH